MIVRRVPAVATIALVVASALAMVGSQRAFAGVGIKGSGSSFAGIELQQWAQDVAVGPYNLDVNWANSSSGAGRNEFYQNTVDFAVSDIRYNVLDDGNSIPSSSSFMYIPVTAGGVSFMYNLPGFGVSGRRIQLSSRTICGIFTGAIQQWNDPAIGADNPGVTLPNVAVHPVVRTDSAGTTFVLEEYCIALQPALYAAFAADASKSGTSLSATTPQSTWPLINGAIGANGSDGAAATVAISGNSGYITAVEPGYADAHGLPYASVLNDTGAYLQPTPAHVGAALSHATQRDDGTHVLNFSPGDPAAYNPSTYSYLILPASPTGARGATLTAFANYVLTIGQTEANSLTYASIGGSLENYGLNRIKTVPGWVAPTAAETAAISTQSITQQSGSGGGTTPTTAAPATGTTATTAASSSKTTGGSSSASTSSGGSAAGSRSTTGVLSGGSSSAGSSNGSLAAADPNATLNSPTGPLGSTGVNAEFVLSGGLFLVLAGEFGRRRTRRRRSAS